MKIDKFILILLLLFIFSCSHLSTPSREDLNKFNPTVTLPKPVEIINEEDSLNKVLTLKNDIKRNIYRQSPRFNEWDKKYLINKTKIIIKDNLSHLEVRDIKLLIDILLDFLINTFGSPPLIETDVQLIFGNFPEHHASVQIGKGEIRKIKIDTMNLFESNNHFIIHELFHSYYQTDEIFNHNEEIYEGWATYAQYKFKYQSLSNEEIRNIFLRGLKMNLKDLEEYDFKNVPWEALPYPQRMKNYLISSIKLFSRPHYVNYISYRGLICKP